VISIKNIVMVEETKSILSTSEDINSSSRMPHVKVAFGNSEIQFNPILASSAANLQANLTQTLD